MTISHRPLTASEIKQLLAQGCTCSQWSDVTVAAGFRPDRVRACHFSGTVRLGRLDGSVRRTPDWRVPAGLYEATLHDCQVGDDVLIRHVGGHLAHLDIADHVVIDHVGRIEVTERSSFGNGTPVHVLQEGGARSVPLYDRLSAPLAYLLAFTRHRPPFVDRVTTWIGRHAEQTAASRASLGAGAVLQDCGVLRNVRVGPAARLDQVTCLERGSVHSAPTHPTVVGPGVVARDFILAAGATVTDGTDLAQVFVGQGAVLRRFRAEHSLFFANSEAFLGEACSVFAGPLTVTHHQNTLLVAAAMSFFNAGSGTNQSNHMYRLGPRHQGIFERGCKTASDAYLCWPARLGPFCLVKGRHATNPDLPQFPFSYLLERQGRSHLRPGAALATVGLARDDLKWSQRDRRRAADRLDPYVSTPLNPLTVQRLLRGLTILERSAEQGGDLTYGRTHITQAARDRGIQLYRWARDQFLGRCLAERLHGLEVRSPAELASRLKPETPDGAGPWSDLSGLLVPAELVDRAVDDVCRGDLTSLTALDGAIRSWHERYPELCWSWAASVLGLATGGTAEHNLGPLIVDQLGAYQRALTNLHEALKNDAHREYDHRSRSGYGPNPLADDPNSDFIAIHGREQDDVFLNKWEESVRSQIETADTLIAQIDQIL